MSWRLQLVVVGLAMVLGWMSHGCFSAWMGSARSRAIVSELVALDAAIKPASSSLQGVETIRTRLKAMTFDSSVPPIIGQALVASEKSLWLNDPARLILAREYIAYATTEARNRLEATYELAIGLSLLVILLTACIVFLLIHQRPDQAPDQGLVEQLDAFALELGRINSGPVAASVSHADWINSEIKAVNLRIGDLDDLPEGLLSLDDRNRSAIEDTLQELPRSAHDLVVTMRKVFNDLDELRESCDEVAAGSRDSRRPGQKS
jgi:hypothetical protein